MEKWFKEIEKWIGTKKLIAVILLSNALVLGGVFAATGYSRLVAGDYGLNNTAAPQLVINPMAEYNTNDIVTDNAVLTLDKTLPWQDVAAKGVFKCQMSTSGLFSCGWKIKPPKGIQAQGMCQIDIDYHSNTTANMVVYLNSVYTPFPMPSTDGKLLHFTRQVPCDSTTATVYVDGDAATGAVIYVAKINYTKAAGPFVAQPENTFSAYINGTAISNKSGPDHFDTSTVTDTSLTTLTFKGLTSPPNCTFDLWTSSYGTNTRTIRIEGTVTSSSIGVRGLGADSTLPSGKQSGSFYITCNKTGKDEIQNVVPVSSLDTNFAPFTGSIVGSTSGTLNVGTGGGAEQTMEWARRGDEILINYRVRVGSSGTSNATGTYIFPLPSGIVPADPQWTTAGYGDVTVVASGAPVARLIGKIFSNRIIFDRNDSASFTNAGGLLFANANIMSASLRFKVQGWDARSSGIMVYQDPPVIAIARNGANQNIPNAAWTTLTTWNTVENTAGLLNAPTGVMTANEAGLWEAELSINQSSLTAASGAAVRLVPSVGTSSEATSTIVTGSAWFYHHVKWAGYLPAGGTITPQFYQDSGSIKNVTPAASRNIYIFRKVK